MSKLEEEARKIAQQRGYYRPSPSQEEIDQAREDQERDRLAFRLTEIQRIQQLLTKLEQQKIPFDTLLAESRLMDLLEVIASTLTNRMYVNEPRSSYDYLVTKRKNGNQTTNNYFHSPDTKIVTGLSSGLYYEKLEVKTPGFDPDSATIIDARLVAIHANLTLEYNSGYTTGHMPYSGSAGISGGGSWSSSRGISFSIDEQGTISQRISVMRSPGLFKNPVRVDADQFLATRHLWLHNPQIIEQAVLNGFNQTPLPNIPASV